MLALGSLDPVTLGSRDLEPWRLGVLHLRLVRTNRIDQTSLFSARSTIHQLKQTAVGQCCKDF